jgi:hypothetical protein
MFHSRADGLTVIVTAQIHIDVLRTNPSLTIFQQPVVQEVTLWPGGSSSCMQIMERILYIWAIRHPGSGYVQGINDLLTPFLAVFLSANICKCGSLALLTV